MATCPTCNISVRTGAKFCTSCGTRLSSNDMVANETTESTQILDALWSSGAPEWPSAPEWPEMPSEAPQFLSDTDASSDMLFRPDPTDLGQRKPTEGADVLPSFEQANADDPVLRTVVPASPAAPTPTASTVSQPLEKSADLARALLLLDELRRIVPALAVERGNANLEAAAILSRIVDPDDSNLAALQQVLRRVVEQPRDLEALSQLAAVAPSMLELLTAHLETIAVVRQANLMLNLDQD